MRACYDYDDILQKEIFKEYGFQGLFEYFYNSYESFAKKYPLNRSLIECSKTIIVHTKKAFSLANEIYKNNDITHSIIMLHLTNTKYITFINQIAQKDSQFFSHMATPFASAKLCLSYTTYLPP